MNVSSAGEKFIGVYPSELNDSFLAFAPEYLCRIRNVGDFEWFVDDIQVSSNLNNTFISHYGFILKEIDSITPIFCRFYDDLPNLELHKRKILFTILNLAEMLYCANLKFCIFLTGSTHHIDTFICDMACRISGINKIYLYTTLFTKDRLLPILQTGGVDTRKPLLLDLSDFSFQDAINTIHSEYKSDSWLYLRKNGIPHIIWGHFKRDLRKKVARVRNFPYSKKSKHFYPMREWKFYTTISSILAYKRAQKFLKKTVENHKISYTFLKNKKAFVIYLHFEPEATVFPEGGQFHNTLDLVAEIKNLYDDIEIIIKEHPAMIYVGEGGLFTRSSIARSVDFYKQLISFGCYIVDQDFALGEFHIAVTLTGSIALERGLMGQKTVVVGYPWFKGMPCTYTLEEFMTTGVFENTTSHENAKMANEFISNILNYNTIFNYELINFFVIKNRTHQEAIQSCAEQKLLLSKLLEFKNDS